jgi:DNA-binding response OmpR family regulator
MRILVVDDDANFLDVVCHCLGKLGHQVEKARDGQEAIELLQREEIHLVVTDWAMPRMDGIELCKAIRSTIQYDIYVIMLTGKSSSVAKMDGLSAGADDYLYKPFGNADLAASIRAAEQVLSLPSANSAVAAQV